MVTLLAIPAVTTISRAHRRVHNSALLPIINIMTVITIITNSTGITVMTIRNSYYHDC